MSYANSHIYNHITSSKSMFKLLFKAMAINGLLVSFLKSALYLSPRITFFLPTETPASHFSFFLLAFHHFSRIAGIEIKIFI